MTSASLWLVQGNCGDYYCGCGGGHPIGVYSTPELAAEAKAVAEVATEAFAHYAFPKPRPQWHGVDIEEIKLDQMPPVFTMHGVTVEALDAEPPGERPKKNEAHSKAVRVLLDATRILESHGWADPELDGSLDDLPA